MSKTVDDVVEAEIHEPTPEEELAELSQSYAELAERWNETDDERRRFRKALDDLDGEARAFDRCVKALIALEGHSPNRYGSIQSALSMPVGQGPVVRVLEALAARFGHTLSASQLAELVAAKGLDERERHELEAFRREFGQLRQAAERVEQAAYPPMYR